MFWVCRYSSISFSDAITRTLFDNNGLQTFTTTSQIDLYWYGILSKLPNDTISLFSSFLMFVLFIVNRYCFVTAIALCLVISWTAPVIVVHAPYFGCALASVYTIICNKYAFQAIRLKYKTARYCHLLSLRYCVCSSI